MYIHLVIEDLCALYLLGCSLVTYPIFKACAQAQAHLLLEWSGENRNWFTRRYLPFCYWICRRWFQILHWGLGVHVARVADPPWLVGRPLLLASMHLQSTSRLCLFQYTPFWITVCHMLSWLLKWLIKSSTMRLRSHGLWHAPFGKISMKMVFSGNFLFMSNSWILLQVQAVDLGTKVCN